MVDVDVSPGGDVIHAVDVSRFALPARDGFPLGATLYTPLGAAGRAALVLIAPATGVKRGFYDKYARFLASRGLGALTFDYRGIGDSRPRRLRGFRASLSDWAEQDLAGVIDWSATQLEPRRLLLVGHSIGGQLLGLAPNNERVAALLAVAVQSGYWRLWPGIPKLLMWSLWHVLMPGLTRLCSYFPAKRLGLAEDLPSPMALEWARWGRSPHYIVDAAGRPLRDGFRRFRAPIRSYSFSDDAHAPHAAVQYLMSCFENAPKELSHYTPAELSARAVGHFGFFRERFQASLWAESAAWLRAQAEVPAACDWMPLPAISPPAAQARR